MFAARLLPVAKIDPADWERCLPGEAEGHAYYSACETLPPIGFTLSAVAAFGADGRVVALCPVFRLDYNLATAVQGAARRVADFIGRNFPRLLRLSVIGLGSPLGERCHIGFIVGLSGTQKILALQALLTALTDYATAHRIGMVAVKDLAEPDEIILAASLKQAGYTHVNSLPVAVLDLNEGGEEGYFARLSPSLRRDLKRKLKKAGGVRIEQRPFSAELMATIEHLYKSTRASSTLDYGEFEELPPGYFARVMQALGPRAFLYLYWVGDELAAFNLMFRDDQRLIDKFWGMKREIARQHDLYFISWMHNVRFCLREGIPLLQTGQTAYALKLRLGSRLVPGHVWFRHRNFMVDRMLRVLARFIAYDAMDPDLKTRAKKETMT